MIVGNRRTQRLAIAAAAWTLGISGHCADMDDVLPLPQWTERPAGTPASVETPLLGGFLFPEGVPLDGGMESPLPRPTPLLGSEFPSARPAGDLSLFLPDALLGKAIREYRPPPTPAESLRNLDTEFLAACRESPADEHLIDPDNHVSETQKEDLLRFLQFHARDARVKAYVLVMDRDQSVTSSADLGGVASGSLNSQDSCLAVYPVGEPWRARLFVSASVRRVVEPDYLNSVVQDCAKDAALASDPLEQLHRFTVRLSIRLFWLEKLMGAPHSATGEVPADLVAKREAALAAALRAQYEPMPTHVINTWSLILGGLLSLAGGAATYAALRYRRKRLINSVWILPEIEIPQRLGGAFTGGGGAWIQYR